MDFDNVSGAQTRNVSQVKDQDRDEDVRRVQGVRTYKTSQENMWTSLTNPAYIQEWFLRISGDLKVGGRYKFDGNAGGKILQCDAPNTLELSWEFGGSISWVLLELDAKENETRLSLTHTMPMDKASEAHWTQYGPGATGVGWDLSFLNLALYLESGKALYQERVEGWMGSEAGKAFITDCAGSWGDAHMASGASEDTARAMAKATATAYTA